MGTSTAAGVRSTAMMWAAAYRGALASCALAEVHSNTMLGSWSRASSQSTPSGLASGPIAAARRRPSLVGSTPIMYRGPMAWLRRISLNMRSVPMLPGPTIAAVPRRPVVMNALWRIAL